MGKVIDHIFESILIIHNDLLLFTSTMTRLEHALNREELDKREAECITLGVFDVIRNKPKKKFFQTRQSYFKQLNSYLEQAKVKLNGQLQEG